LVDAVADRTGYKLSIDKRKAVGRVIRARVLNIVQVEKLSNVRKM
jgi:hypothetical protein